jgi:hypothetical protein
MRVFTWRQYAVYVYRETGERHHRPHCNVRWGDRSVNLALDGGTLELLSGRAERLPRGLQAELRARLADLRAAWTELNPDRPVL